MILPNFQISGLHKLYSTVPLNLRESQYEDLVGPGLTEDLIEEADLFNDLEDLDALSERLCGHCKTFLGFHFIIGAMRLKLCYSKR